MSSAARALPNRTFTISAGDVVVTLTAKTVRHALSSAQQRFGPAFRDENITNVHVVRTVTRSHNG